MPKFGEQMPGVVENKKDIRSNYVLSLITKFGDYDGLVRHIREKIDEFVTANENFEFGDEKFLRFVFDDCPEDINRHDLDILASFAKDATIEENITNSNGGVSSSRNKKPNENISGNTLRKAWGHEIRQPEDTYR